MMCLRDQNTHLMNVRAEGGSGGVARAPSFESPIKVVLSSLNYAQSLGVVSNTHTQKYCFMQLLKFLFSILLLTKTAPVSSLFSPNLCMRTNSGTCACMYFSQ